MNREPLDHWLQRLERLHPKAIELGLDRVAAVADRLDLLQPEQPVVTVAGTNGKGSVVAVLEALLREQGVSCGAYTSPHFENFNERIRVDGRAVGDDDIVVALEAIEEARDTVSLTYFEFATLAALYLFKSLRPDVLLLEVGLGGRLDAVNIIDPSVAVITRIDLDHEEWLGKTRAAIAQEKAGILRCGIPAVIGDPDPPKTLVDLPRAVGASPTLFIGADFTCETMSQEHWMATITGTGGRHQHLGPLPLGPLLPENQCTALQVMPLLGFQLTRESVLAAIDHTELKGRRAEHRIGQVDYLLDVAHNPSAVKKLLEYMTAKPCKGDTIAVFSAMSDKDLVSMLEPAISIVDVWFLADQPEVPRAASAASIAAKLSALGAPRVHQSDRLSGALCCAQTAAKPGDRVVVFGSFHTLGALLPLLGTDSASLEAAV
ncbi:MAG: folylpolyglutamate synthase/dihydrofolate synthase family protein [Pseudomonadota bacterium]